MLIDLHTHSYPKSDDSFAGTDDLIERAKNLRLDGVCLTEHDFFWSRDEIKRLSLRHQFLVLAGCEINTDCGHFIVFGLERYLFGLHKPAFLEYEVRQRGGVIIAAHPYRRRFLEETGQQPLAREEMLGKASSDGFLRSCDAIEGINGRGTPSQNRFSQELADRLGLKFTGGSDAHRVDQLGTAATRFERKVCGLDGLIQELKAGRFQAERLVRSPSDERPTEPQR